MSNDPFQDGHRRAAKKIEKDAAAQEVIARDARIDAARLKREKAARPEPVYPWPKRFFEL